MYVLGKQFSDKFTKLYTKSMTYNKKIMMSKMNKLMYLRNTRKMRKTKRTFFKVNLIVLSINNIFSDTNISDSLYSRD